MRLAVIFLVLSTSVAFGQEFTQEVEKDYPLRSIGKLQVINPKGDVSIQGWAFDKVRIKFKKKVQADSLLKAKPLFDSVDYRYFSAEGNIEISSQYGKDLSIEERLQEKVRSQIRSDIVILAPSNLKLRVWTVDGKVTLKSWGSTTEVRSNTGPIRVDGLKSDDLSILCASCSVQLKNVRASLRCVGGSGPLDLHNIHGKNIYVETDSGQMKLSRIQGDQLYFSKSGRIDGQFLLGKVEFHTKSASVELREISGFLSGAVEGGNISASIKDWEFTDKALIESAHGNIDLELPRRFSGDVDIWSVSGKAAVEFPIEKSVDPSVIGPEPANHLTGRVREGGELFKVYTESGDIHVSKGKL